MKYLLYILLFFLSLVSSAQPGAQSHTLAGAISVSSLQSMKVEELMPIPLSFESLSEMETQKIIPGFCRVSIISNGPWSVNVMSSEPYLIERTNGTFRKIPVGLIEIRGNTSKDFMPLSNTPITILQSLNNLISNSYLLDVKVKPPSWKVEGGSYKVNLIFTLTPE